MINTEIKTIATEEIKFYEDTLLGGKDEQGTIWLAVNKTCQGLGFDVDDSKNQVKKINKDSVLKKLSVKFHTQVESDNGVEQSREMLFLSEKGITLWLAKISITAGMKLKYPELSEKLERYQLEVADVLHNYFMGTEEKKEQFFSDTLGIDIKSIMQQNEFLITENKEIKDELHMLNSEFEGFKLFSEQQNQILFTLVKRFSIYENESIKYTRIIDDFFAKTCGTGLINERNKHRMFWEAISNWIGFDVNLLYKSDNKKKYLLEKVGMSILEYFVDNVIVDRIVKRNGNWVNLQGFNADPYNIEKNKILSRWTDKNGKLRCSYCGKIIENPKENENYNYEHIIAKTVSGSTNTIENIIVSCVDCNKEKNVDSYDDFTKKKNTSDYFIKGAKEWTKLYSE